MRGWFILNSWLIFLLCVYPCRFIVIVLPGWVALILDWCCVWMCTCRLVFCRLVLCVDWKARLVEPPKPSALRRTLSPGEALNQAGPAATPVYGPLWASLGPSDCFTCRCWCWCCCCSCFCCLQATDGTLWVIHQGNQLCCIRQKNMIHALRLTQFFLADLAIGWILLLVV